MTVKEFYEWAKEQGVEDYKMVNHFCVGTGEYIPDIWIIDDKKKEIATEFEC